MPTTLRFRERVDASPERVYEVLADFPAYHEWLGRSGSFARVDGVTPYPVRLGTTYVDRGPSGVRYGTVTAYDAPRQLGFSQPIVVAFGPFRGRVAIDIRYTLEADGPGTRVVRDVNLTFSGILTAVAPLAIPAVKRENVRILESLKAHLEPPVSGAPPA